MLNPIRSSEQTKETIPPSRTYRRVDPANDSISTIKKVMVVTFVIFIILFPMFAMAAPIVSPNRCPSGNCARQQPPPESPMQTVPYDAQLIHGNPIGAPPASSLEQLFEAYEAAVPKKPSPPKHSKKSRRSSQQIVKQKKSPKKQKFPHYTKGFVHPGIWNFKDTESIIGCDIVNSTKELDTCGRNAAYAIKSVLSNPQLVEKVFSEERKQNKGFGLFVGEQHVRLGIDPQERINQEKTIDYLEKEVLSKKKFPKKNILTIANKMHQLLVKDLKLGILAIPGGKYRTISMLVNSYDEDEKKSYQRIVESEGKKAADLWEASKIKLAKNHHDFQSLSPEELSIWKKMIYIPPAPEEIPDKMKQFAEQFQQLIHKKSDPIALAAWVHMELVRIHPYVDGTGRLARMMMNAIFLHYGLNPPIFKSDKEYTQAIFQDGKEPGAFATYLAKAIEWTEKQSSIPEKF